jgi:lipopolysaccharide export system protein LptA
MNKKTVLQFFLLLVVLIIFSFISKTYFPNKKGEKIIEKNNIENNEKIILEENSNLIKNISYFAEDKRGNNYSILSQFGKINEDEPDLITLIKVTAFINMREGSQIKISSDRAIYNKFNYNSNFQDNVLVIYQGHKITSERLDLMFEKNIITIFDNVIYKNLNTKLEADKIEIDLITKKSRIFMNKKSEKVKIISLN